jgi:hypothetical protein
VTGPCRCWTNTNALGHEGHCCWLDPADTYQLGSLPPCGHWHPDVPRPQQEVPAT